MNRVVMGLVLALCIITFVGSGLAAPPPREEQLVYGISAWDGNKFASTFVPRGVEMFLLADVDHVINGTKTDVYYWDITQEWMGNWMEKRIDVPGQLEILDSDGNLVSKQDMMSYGYRLRSGQFTPSELLKGDEAHRAYEAYRQELERYYQAVNDYRTARVEYEETLLAMVQHVQETGVPYDESEIPDPPVEPSPPTEFVGAPLEAFIVNLPPGKYRIRMVNEAGVIPDSERSLTVFSARRHGVGYEILPESRWTRPVMSDDSSHILYLHGPRTMYLKAFTASEYSAYEFLRMVQAHKPLAGRGMKGMWQWQRGQELENIQLQVVQGGEVVETAPLAPYYVQQTPGYALGYEIVEFDPDKVEMAGRRPSFAAFKLVLEPGSYVIRAIDEAGNVVPGSVREIRTIKEPPPCSLYLLAAIPLFFGIGLSGLRRFTSRSRTRSEAL